MHLHVLLEPKVDLPRLSQVLDELGHLGRLDTIYGWGKKEQAKLFEAAQGFRPLTLDHFVPEGTAPLTEVIHWGKNTLPAFTHFQKRFTRPSDPEVKDQLWGYNHQNLASMTGPGYFVAHTGQPGDVEGEIAIDYRQIPKEKPGSWPEILPNSAKLGRFVYDGMVDVMRGLSSHVSIGRAQKKGKWMDAWFVLLRQDPTPAS